MGFAEVQKGEPSRRGVVEAMDCQQFLDHFSEFLDGNTESESWGEMDRHRSGCEECRRYAHTLQSGLEVLKDLPPLEVTPDFQARLARRILHLEVGPSVDRSSTGSGATLVSVLSVAALVALAAWAPSVRRPRPVLELPAVVVAEPPAPTFTRVQPRPTFPRSFSLFTRTEFRDGIWGDSHSLLREYSPILEHRRSQPLIRVGVE